MTNVSPEKVTISGSNISLDHLLAD